MSSQLSTLPSHLTLDVPNGIGTTKSVLNVQPNGPSMLIKSVSPFLTNAKNMMLLVPAPLVSKDTTWSTELASSLPSTMLSPPTQDVPNGTGTTKFALNAQKSGFSTLMEFV